MSRRLVSMIGAAALLWVGRTAFACDSTTCSLLTRDRDGRASVGSLHLDVSFRYTSEDRGISTAGDGRVFVPFIDFANQTIRPNYHVELPSDVSVAQVDAQYGLNQSVTLLASLPYLARSFGYLHTLATPAPSGATTDEHAQHVPFDPFGNNVEQHFRTSGIGDLQTGATYSVDRNAQRFVAGLSLRVPTGPYRLSDPTIGIFHPEFQPGTGAWGYIGSLHYAKVGTGSGWSATASYLRSSTNGLDYRPGDELLAAVSANLEMSPQVRGSLQVKLSWLQQSRYRDERVPSTGASFVYLNPGVQWTPAPRVRLYAYVPIPMFRSVVDAQYVPRISMLAGVSRAF
jgi:hypothetical protein